MLVLANVGIPIHASVEAPHLYLCAAPFPATIDSPALSFKVTIPIPVPGDIPSPTTADALILMDVEAPTVVSSIPVHIEVTSKQP